MPAKTWTGPIPTECNLCHGKLDGGWVDGSTRFALGWAIMCIPCHKEKGMGFGVGRGQHYDATGKYIEG